MLFVEPTLALGSLGGNSSTMVREYYQYLHIIYSLFGNSTDTNVFCIFSVLGDSDLNIDAAVIIGSAWRCQFPSRLLHIRVTFQVECFCPSWCSGSNKEAITVGAVTDAFGYQCRLRCTPQDADMC